MSEIAANVVDVHVFCRTAGRALVLVLHRAPQKRYAGTWRMVAGKIEPSETPVQTALREVKEETGLEATAIWVLDYVHSFYDDEENRIMMAPVLAVEVSPGKVTLDDEHDECRWLPFEQAMSLLRRPGHREGLQRAFEDVIEAEDRGASFRITL